MATTDSTRNRASNGNACSVDECETVGQTRRGMCPKHYKRWQARGDTSPAHFERFGSPVEALKARSERRGECIIWTGSATPQGYGNISVEGKIIRAHRFAWEQANGPIPAGMLVDHVCHVKSCVNPEHLRVVTHKQNLENLKGSYRNNQASKRGVGPMGDKWRVRVTHNQTVHYGGVYETVQEAEAAAIKLRNSLFTCNTNDRNPANG